MIYSNEFVWLHFPKCAGTKIEQLFGKYFSKAPGVFQDTVGITLDPSIAWHDSLAEREARDPGFTRGARTIICSFRRLPSWLESRYNFEAWRSPRLPHRPELLLEGRFLERSGRSSHADDYARRYLPPDVLGSGRVKFLRTEFFAADFRATFGEFLDVSRIPPRAFRRKVNVSWSYLPTQIRRQLHDASRTIYDCCPYWRSVEEAAYGPLPASAAGRKSA
jgi:hypothetical protein